VFENLGVYLEGRRVVSQDLEPAGLPAPASAATTARAMAKADRRDRMLAEAARLFARAGYDGVSIEDLGRAAGVSGPAVYRHFPSKQAVLAALLVGTSDRLLAGGREVVAGADDEVAALRSLVRFHVEFALANPDIIRVQDRELNTLAAAERRSVRATQRSYVEVWVSVLVRLSPGADPAELRLRAQATFGLLNSTPHSARSAPRARGRELLEEMALAALGQGS
jgi:AcrR family transcriptional regulator